MLKIIGVADVGPAEVEFGDYLPLKFAFPSEVGVPHLYWRTGDLSLKLLELQVDRINGSILAASLILPGMVAEGLPDYFVPEQVTLGTPAIAVEGWPENRMMDDPQEFSVFVDEERLLIRLDMGVASRMIVSSNISFGIDGNDFLVWMVVETPHARKLLALN